METHNKLNVHNFQKPLDKNLHKFYNDGEFLKLQLSSEQTGVYVMKEFDRIEQLIVPECGSNLTPGYNFKLSFETVTFIV